MNLLLDKNKMSNKELLDNYNLSKVEGGEYNQQLHTNLLLD